MVRVVPLSVRVWAMGPVLATQELVSVPMDWVELFRMTVVALLPVWDKFRLPVPRAEPALTVMVPLPIWVVPVFVLAVPERVDYRWRLY